MASGNNIFLAEATIPLAKCRVLIAVQKLEVQLNQVRIVKIGRKVVPGARRMPAHADDSTSNFGRKLINMLRTPGVVVRNQTAAGEGVWLTAK